MYQAYNGMGFSYRKTGDYAKALEMYDQRAAAQAGVPGRRSSIAAKRISA